MSDPQPPWWVFRGEASLPPPPPWRRFDAQGRRARGVGHLVRREEIELINAALYLRRPLLVTGKPGTGKTTLAYAVAEELGYGTVLLWPITTRSSLQEGLYRYDAIARLQDAGLRRGEAGAPAGDEAPAIGSYMRLGPLGTALLPSPRPRVLLIDEIDKSDIDLPNDLLNIFEEGEYVIPELERLAARTPEVEVPTYDGGRALIRDGRVRCTEFPLVVLTSNGEREFPPAFLRRCLRLEIRLPDKAELVQIVRSRLGLDAAQLSEVDRLIDEFLARRDDARADIATDQLLNAIYLTLSHAERVADRETLRDALFRPLAGPGAV